MGEDAVSLSGSTRIRDLLEVHPFLEDFLVALNPKFAMLRSRMARATVGRLATLQTAAEIADVQLPDLLQAVAREIERQTGTRSDFDRAGTERARTRAERIEILKSIVSDLHAGGDLREAQTRFAQAVVDVDASEVAEMEEELIRSGLPVSEVQRLCDVHVGAFREALDEHVGVSAPPGHPVHTYLADNQEITRLADELAQLAREAAQEGGRAKIPSHAAEVLAQLLGVENHYQRKENQLFPLLERHDVSGPSKVMWGVHDEIRMQLRSVRQAAEQSDASTFAREAVALSRSLIEMVYKEEKILFPMSMESLSEAEWAEIRRGEDVLGYVLTEPAVDWPTQGSPPPVPGPRETLPGTPASPGGSPANGLLQLATGELTLEQVRLLLTHLPVDVTYVDETDTVRFYSEGPERIFPRSPAVIGRKVQNCHPPKSVAIVEEILDAFRAGRRDVAEFWIPLGEKFVHIRYFAIRSAEGVYRGCLEVSQDVTDIRHLEGERRLLDWRT
jgi:DUF438 domain-containing protein